MIDFNEFIQIGDLRLNNQVLIYAYISEGDEKIRLFTHFNDTQEDIVVRFDNLEQRDEALRKLDYIYKPRALAFGTEFKKLEYSDENRERSGSFKVVNR